VEAPAEKLAATTERNEEICQFALDEDQVIVGLDRSRICNGCSHTFALLLRLLLAGVLQHDFVELTVVRLVLSIGCQRSLQPGSGRLLLRPPQ
jgi:hypothetical protein